MVTNTHMATPRRPAHPETQVTSSDANPQVTGPSESFKKETKRHLISQSGPRSIFPRTFPELASCLDLLVLLGTRGMLKWQRSIFICIHLLIRGARLNAAFAIKGRGGSGYTGLDRVALSCSGSS